MYKKKIISALLKVTLLVVNVLKGEYSIEEFVNEYGNFYYYEALDGHEADDSQKRVLDKLHNVIEFHEKVQTEIVDLTYLGNGKKSQQYIDAGLISITEARKRLEELSKRYDVEELMKILKN